MYVIKGMHSLNIVRSNIFFTSDHLFFDEDINKNLRGFNSVDEMNEYFIVKWNSVVNKKDVVFHLGNFSVGDTKLTKNIINKLNGKIHLIVGNKDTHYSILSCKEKLCSVSYRLDIFINDISITMNHYPQLNWNRKEYGAWMLHGSTLHNQPYLIFDNILDVGVDGYDGQPITFENIYEIMNNKKLYYNKKNKFKEYIL